MYILTPCVVATTPPTGCDYHPPPKTKQNICNMVPDQPLLTADIKSIICTQPNATRLRLVMSDMIAMAKRTTTALVSEPQLQW